MIKYARGTGAVDKNKGVKRRPVTELNGGGQGIPRWEKEI